MKPKLIFILFAFVLLYTGCKKIELGKSFDAHMGDKYRITSDLSFIINSLNDSRCPKNAVCAWAGDLHLFVNIYLANNMIDTVLYQDPTGKYPYIFGDYKISILDAIPQSTGTRTSKDITIRMIISK
jgi:hypothetical protein